MCETNFYKISSAQDFDSTDDLEKESLEVSTFT